MNLGRCDMEKGEKTSTCAKCTLTQNEASGTTIIA